MFKEFREFIQRGNVLDLAVGVIIGGAFGKIVTSLVDDVLMPPLGFLLGKVDFSDLFISMNGQQYASLKAAKDAGAPVIGYGSFLNNVVQFALVAFAIFMLVKVANRIKRAAEEAALLGEPKVAEPAKEDPQAKLVKQNERVIELLETIAGKSGG